MPGLLRYTESELDPVVHAVSLLESARNEARMAIFEIMLALIFGAFLGFSDPRIQVLAWFVLITVVPLLVDSAIRRAASSRLKGKGPQPA